jgi:hypothetical protein
MPLLRHIKDRLRREQSTKRPTPPNSACNYIIIILDSCRFDSLTAAKPKHILNLGELQRRYSYATWTAPSHYNLLMGLLPHPSPQNVFASNYYKDDFKRFSERLQIPSIDFEEMIPRMWLPHFLRNVLGYYTRAIVSLPVLNPHTPIAVDFDSYEMTEHHNNLSAIIDQLQFSKERPTFYLINTGETHYPYASFDEPPSQWPKIHGAHGVFKNFSQGQPLHKSSAPQFFEGDRLRELKERQINVLTNVDRSIEKLFDTVPANTYITITSDHGELFGEDDYFGHGPINHSKVLEVPFIEGKIK